MVISTDSFNASRLATVIAAVITSNTALASTPGDVFLPPDDAGLPKDSVVNVTALVAMNKTDLEGPVGHVRPVAMHEVDPGLRLSLGL